MNGIRVFEKEEFGQVRVFINEANETLFSGADVANILGYVNAREAIRNHVDEDDAVVMQLSDIQEGSETTPPHMRGSKIKMINESGVYSLIMRSNMPKAKAFKKWVTSEVLPSLRKDGGYVVANDNDDEVMILARGMIAAGKAIERKDIQIAEANKTIAIKEAIIERTSWLTMSQLCQIDGLPDNVPAIHSLLIAIRAIEKIVDKNTMKGYRIVPGAMEGIIKADVKYLDNNSMGYSKIVVNPEKINSFINKIKKAKQNVKIN